MNKIYLLSTLAALLLCGLVACSPRQEAPMSLEERHAMQAKAQCQQEASDMVDEGPQNSDDPLWAGYFEMCMHRLGVTDAELKKMWN